MNKKEQKEYNQRYYQKNKEKCALKDKKWRVENPNYMGEWRKKNKEYFREKQKEYVKRHPKMIKEKIKQYKKNNPEKIKARNMANSNLKYLSKPGYEFHHPDYSQPLLVEVLPIAEHKALHTQLNK